MVAAECLQGLRRRWGACTSIYSQLLGGDGGQIQHPHTLAIFQGPPAPFHCCWERELDIRLHVLLKLQEGTSLWNLSPLSIAVVRLCEGQTLMHITVPGKVFTERGLYDGVVWYIVLVKEYVPTRSAVAAISHQVL